MKTHVLRVQNARRVPNPNLKGAERHFFTVSATELPDNLPKDPNPREQNTDLSIYREITNSLLNTGDNTPNTFYDKNKGITILANCVHKLSEFEYQLDFLPGQGVLDGGHTYKICCEARQSILDYNQRIAEAQNTFHESVAMSEAESQNEFPDFINQFVEVRVMTGMPPELTSELAGGLNTSVQVQQWTLANLENQFEWIKAELKDESYLSKIAFRQNEKDTALDVRDILMVLDLFNISDFPTDKDDFPVRAYSSKNAVLSSYIANPDKYKKLQPILKDILQLHDIISIEASSCHNRTGGKFGSLAFTESTRGRSFLFTGDTAEYRLTRGALFPMLGAFRWMIEETPKGIQWKGDFNTVKNLLSKSAGELMAATQQTSNDLGRNPNAIGKSRNHWANLYRTLAFKQVTSG
jgi:hypothetical protein